ncbi:MAG: 50S ribosomal protein L32 [Firmicutes bacterium]|nr:50S ribosomal protein L32 [Bacillota bacterium]
MGVPKRKRSKARNNARRAMIKISAPGLVECPQCHELRMSHYVCASCGYYKTKEVIKAKKPSK